MKTELDYEFWFEQYKVESPYPVLTKELETMWAKQNALFWPEGFQKPRIEISNSLSPEMRLLALFHELTHAKHYKRKCQCFNDKSRFASEMHACYGEVKLTLKTNNKELAQTCIKEFHRVINNIDFKSYPHYNAMKFIMQTKRWRKLERLANENS